MIALAVLRGFFSAIGQFLGPLLARRHGRHGHRCHCKSKPNAAYPGDQWRCPQCAQIYVAEIYSGRVCWLVRLYAPTYKLPERRSS
jgi:hypothetical protein